MLTKKITDGIYYVGANDRTTTRFEGLWPLPYGVSYNSYLVTGSDKTAIIDGVEISHASRLPKSRTSLTTAHQTISSSTTWSLTTPAQCRHCAPRFPT